MDEQQQPVNVFVVTRTPRDMWSDLVGVFTSAEDAAAAKHALLQSIGHEHDRQVDAREVALDAMQAMVRR